MIQASLDPVLLAVASFSQALEKEGIPYLIGGSFASSVQGEYRATNDIDFVCKLTEKKTLALISEIEPEFICDQIAILAALKEKRSFNIFHEETCLKIDVFTRIDLFQEEELRRAVDLVLPSTDFHVKIATSEDVILSKLSWYKLGNESSERQWRDILGVLKVQADRLDLPYIRKWAETLKVSELLEKILKQL